ncbi:MAG: magnesium transporter [Planctomycetota bacterium]|jgi:magnesium transporter
MADNTEQCDIHALIEGRDFRQLKAALCEMEVHDLTEMIESLDGEDLAFAFRLLPLELATEVFGDLPLEHQEELFATLSSEKFAAILNEMAPDERTDFLEELPGELAQRLLSALRGEELTVARNLLAYPEDSIGRLMTPEYAAVRPDWSLDHVLRHIRKVAEKMETINVVYVVDDHWALLDEIRLEELVLADPSAEVRDLMDEQFASLRASDDREAAIEMFKKYDAFALPVVNSQGILVGIVTVDDVLDVAEEEDTEDFQKMAGMDPLDQSYFGTSTFGMLRKRLPWLVLLLGAQMLTTVALTGFHSLPIFAVLVVFMPLINSPAGNAGSQTAGLMIRGLAVQEMAATDWRRVFVREITHGLSLGLILSVVGYAAALLFCKFLPTGEYRPEQIALSVAISLVIVVCLANLIGSMLPFFFKRFGLDPAVTSGPFIASLMDVSGIVIYFTIASLVLVKLA